jgi:hypothetical protein
MNIPLLHFRINDRNNNPSTQVDCIIEISKEIFNVRGDLQNHHLTE